MQAISADSQVNPLIYLVLSHDLVLENFQRLSNFDKDKMRGNSSPVSRTTAFNFQPSLHPGIWKDEIIDEPRIAFIYPPDGTILLKSWDVVGAAT